MISNSINFEDTEVSTGVDSNLDTVTITLNSDNVRQRVKLNKMDANSLPDQILFCIGEKTTEQWENENLKLQAKIEELENLIEQREEYEEMVRDKHPNYF
jgi:hypothetical protein